MIRPRVVILTTYYRPIVGGVESTAERFAQYLHQHEHAVRVLTKRVTRDLADREEMDGIPIERIGPYGERTASGKWRLVPAATRWLMANRARYDVVCCIDYRGVGVASVLARALTKKPALLQAQTTGVLSGANADALLGGWRLRPNGGIGQALKWPVLATYRRADGFACISHEIEREVLSVGVPRERVHYLPNAVDMRRFRQASLDEQHGFRQSLNIDPGAVVCLFVGRLSREKGLMDLMEAWRLAETTRAVLLVAGPDMVGNTWDVGPAAREFVERHGLGASVRFLGSISDVAPLVRNADVVIQPSHFEALGLSAIEALASGVPVIASAVGGLREFIVDDENGKLSPPHDPRALAQCVRALVNNGAHRHRLAERARASVADYDEQVVFKRFAEVLATIAK